MTADSGYQPTYLPYQDPSAQDARPAVRKRFFGKYRGSVAENVDPLGQGRLMVLVPDVLGVTPSTWALPCVPMAGPDMGTSFMPPPVGASVWVEFEQGDPQQPIWVGCFWDTPDSLGTLGLVAAATPTPAITLETLTAGVGISDTPDLGPGANVTLYADEGEVSISLDPAGVTITAPTVSIVTTSFTVNGAEFTVT
jgi:Type VI secretion system/phage-baseplate injector OB domain